MARSGGNTARNCSTATLQQCSSQMRCPDDYLARYIKYMDGQMWRVNALLLFSTILVGVMVGIGGYGQRYRHHPFTRFIFIGATTLFLPIVSYLISSVGRDHDYYVDFEYDHSGPLQTLTAVCGGVLHPTVVIASAFLVQIAAINTSVIVACDDREGRIAGPPVELLIQGAWIIYLNCIVPWYQYYVYSLVPSLPFVVICGKMVLKHYAFENARKSFAFGHNPRLILGYMHKLELQEESQHGETMIGGDAPPPPLLVMGEETRHVEKQPHGYMFNDDSGASNICLITIYTIWEVNSISLMPAPQRLKDLCLSFALFKLLRCRFARYQLANSGSKATLSFFWSSLLLKVGQHDRIFGVIEDELSFVHDYYYSSIPISYSKCWLPILGIFSSLTSISCIVVLICFGPVLWRLGYEVVGPTYNRQISCWFQCSEKYLGSHWQTSYFGWAYMDVTPAILLVALVVIVEVRDIASYICSNWTKMQADETLGRKNESVLSTGISEKRTLALVLLTRLLRLPDQKRKVNVSTTVKLQMIDALKNCNNNGRRLSNGALSLRQSQVGERFLWACKGNGTSDIILTWHIAICILEVRYPQAQGSQSISDSKVVATHLSRYCAYLMAWYPELLPDDDAWSKSLYDDVKKDAARILAGGGAAPESSTPETEYQNLVAMLSEHSNHEVLKSGVKLGAQLAELMQADQETVWRLLAGFWSEMILYVAPSDNLKGHSEAIARGGELITLLWAMLFHAGIVNRPTEAGVV